MKNKIVAELGDCFHLDVNVDYSYWLMLTCARRYRGWGEIEYTFTVIARSQIGDLFHRAGNTWASRVRASKAGITEDQFKALLSLEFGSKMAGRESEVLSTKCQVYHIFTNLVRDNKAYDESVYKRALKIAINEMSDGCPYGSIPCRVCKCGYIKKTVGDCWFKYFMDLAKEESL